MLRVLESQLIGYLTDAFPAVGNLFLGQVYNGVLDVLLRRLAGLFLHQVAEVVGREEHLVGEILHRRQSVPLGLVAVEIVVEQSLEACQHIAVRILSCDELSVVEAHAVVQQQFDVLGDEAFAVLVDGVVQLLLYLVQTVRENPFLRLRQMKCLVGGIRKE